jgi:hypothetical protein
VTTWVRPLALLLILGVVAGCAKPKPRIQPEIPPLNAPAPPRHEVAPVEPEPVVRAPAPLPETPVRQPVRRPAPRTEPARSDAKPESSKGEAAGSKETSRPGTLLTTSPGTEAESERQIRGLLDRASQDLNRVNFGTLSADGKIQYETAQGFIRQAEEALKEKNLPFAANLADKAATFAAVLVGRD